MCPIDFISWERDGRVRARNGHPFYDLRTSRTPITRTITAITVWVCLCAKIMRTARETRHTLQRGGSTTLQNKRDARAALESHNLQLPIRPSRHHLVLVEQRLCLGHKPRVQCINLERRWLIHALDADGTTYHHCDGLLEGHRRVPAPVEKEERCAQSARYARENPSAGTTNKWQEMSGSEVVYWNQIGSLLQRYAYKPMTVARRVFDGSACVNKTNNMNVINILVFAVAIVMFKLLYQSIKYHNHSTNCCVRSVLPSTKNLVKPLCILKCSSKHTLAAFVKRCTLPLWS